MLIDVEVVSIELRARGRLKNGNPGGDFNKAPRCNARARTRGGMPCLAPAIRGKRRCRMHGGLSRGPTTEAGKARSRSARLTQGRYSAAGKQARRDALAREAERRAREWREKETERARWVEWRRFWKF
jgi:hypothetical protein